MPRTEGSIISKSDKHQDDGRTYLVDGNIIHGQDEAGNQLIWEHKEVFPTTELSEEDFQRMRKSGFLRLAEEFATPEELAAKQAALAAQAEALADENAALRRQLEELQSARRSSGKGAASAE